MWGISLTTGFYGHFCKTNPKVLEGWLTGTCVIWLFNYLGKGVLGPFHSWTPSASRVRRVCSPIIMPELRRVNARCQSQFFDGTRKFLIYIIAEAKNKFGTATPRAPCVYVPILVRRRRSRGPTAHRRRIARHRRRWALISTSPLSKCVFSV